MLLNVWIFWTLHSNRLFYKPYNWQNIRKWVQTALPKYVYRERLFDLWKKKKRSKLCSVYSRFVPLKYSFSARSQISDITRFKFVFNNFFLELFEICILQNTSLVHNKFSDLNFYIYKLRHLQVVLYFIHFIVLI